MILARCVLLLLLTALPSLADGFAPAIYPFRNGVSYATVDEGARALKAMGYEGVGSVHGKVLPEYLKAYDAAGLKVFSIYVGGKVSATSHTHDESVGRAIDQLKGRDALVELFVQGGKDANDEQAVAFVREIAARAEKAGLRVVLYPHARFYVDTVGDAVRIAKASECKNVGVAFNLCHFLKVEPGKDLRKTLEEAKPLLWSVSTCGAEQGGTDWKALIQPLDAGSFDQGGLMRHLREIGYQGDVGLQCYGIRIPSREHLPRSLKAWRSILEGGE